MPGRIEMDMADKTFRHRLHIAVDKRQKPEPGQNDDHSFGRLEQGHDMESCINMTMAATAPRAWSFFSHFQFVPLISGNSRVQ